MKNKKKRKGFTLIELLAVIIVLAIIALIATPIIFNVIENAKIKSLENSCYGVIDAVRTKYAEGLLNSENGLVDLTGDVANLTIAGEHPYMGTWTIDNSKDSAESGIKIEGVKFASMKNYTCSNVDENGAITNKVSCEQDGVDEVDEVQPTITAKQGTVEVNKGTVQKIKDYFTVKFGKTGGQVTCEVANVSELDVGDHTVKCTATETNGKTAEASIKITIKDVFALAVDNSGANKPVLYTNMIPVVYDGTKWLYSDGTQTNWYNYTDKQWANAVVLNSGVTKNVGDEVTEEEISLWYVWIPKH
ncbi:MAG: prepilin-type N-terminal cleavage/methylation domain-containing protein [Acholeplasma sp.]|nr:prepilin-type N-terminal cleavage/methylation domain-containing protein [Acholeplasma sp.]